jgi:hypothetical protein
MADNVAYTPGSGATVAADDVGGILHQRVKAVIGGDGSASDLSDQNPYPTRQGIPTTQKMTRVAINFSASGDNTIVSAVAAQKARLFAFFLKVKGATDLKWKNGAGADFHPALPFASGDGWSEMGPGEAIFECSTNTALILNSSNAVQVSGYAYFTQEA